MAWPHNPRPAKSIVVLRDQVSAIYPPSGPDWMIGDPAHQARSSDHNAWVRDGNVGIVTAIDIRGDTRKGFDLGTLAEALRAERDLRTKYVIFKRRIFYGNYKDYPPWTWQHYGGPNPHNTHVHVSVKAEKPLFDSVVPWQLGFGAPYPERETEPVLREKIAREIFEREVRRKAGVMVIYQPSDGSHEVAGINDRYHPKEFAKIAALMRQGAHQAAEAAAVDYVARYTDGAASWHDHPGVEAYLRDCWFNRGARGSARILQMAVGVNDDGSVGPITRGAIAKLPPDQLLTRLRAAREAYERKVLNRDESSAVWKGLVNRWDGVLAFARSITRGRS